VLSRGVDRFVEGEGRPPVAAWARPELLGEPAGDLPELDRHLRPLQRCHLGGPGQPTVPALIVADVPDAKLGEALAISVNGVVRATAPAIDDGGRKVTAMVPASALRDGANDVRVHRIRR
jgi:hypothetical protein